MRRRFQKFISNDLELQDGTGYGYKLSLNNDELKAAVEAHSKTDSQAMISMLKLFLRTARTTSGTNRRREENAKVDTASFN